VPFDGYVPLFIRAGSIVHTQDVTDVRRSRHLNNVFQLRVALDENSYAEGTMLMIDDYNDDDNVIESCVEQNCVARLVAQGNVIDHQFTLQLLVEGEQQSDTVF